MAVTWSAGRGRVLLFDLDAGDRVATWATPVGPSGYSDAAGVAIDAHFRLFVADPHNDCVRCFNAFGRHLHDIGVGVGERARRRDLRGVLERPHGLAVHGDSLLVAMGDEPRQRGVQRFRLDGSPLPPLAARGEPANRFAAPRDVWADADGLVVADTLRGRVQLFDARGVHVCEFGLPGAHVHRPIGVARRPDGAIVVADRGDHARLVLLGTDGRALPDIAALDRACAGVLAVCCDPTGRVYVLDHDGERVIRADAQLAFDGVVVELAEHV